MSNIPQPGRRPIEATRVGYIAANVLKSERRAKVVGVTSRGIYLKSSSRWMVFVSGEAYSSPLTITTSDNGGCLDGVRIGDKVKLKQGVMVIADSDLEIEFGGSATWKARPPARPASSVGERMERLNTFGREVMRRKKGEGLGNLLPRILGWGPEGNDSGEGLNPLHRGVVELLPIIQAGQVGPLLESLVGLMGAGQGLTPAGDDFIVGLSLSWNRWKDILWSEDELCRLNKWLIEAAYKKTTMLSANLIECATYGQADERLIKAVDFLMCGEEDNVGRVVDELLGWGSSSGVDAFAGMATVLM
jgi:hypothetical protein